MLTSLLSKMGFTTLVQLFLISILALVVAGAVIFFKQYSIAELSPLVAPISSFGHAQVAENVWFPQTQVLGQKAVNLTSKAAFFVEVNSGQVLFDKDSHQRLKVASLTKIMATIIALEHKKFTDQFTVPEAVTNMEPDKMYLKSGERLSLEELLDGIYLVSANDAAEVIAQGTLSSRAEFIKQMNDKAIGLGMNDSKFINPTGLEEDDSTNPDGFKTQYSSAYDVVLMSRYAIKHWPKLTDITSQSEIYLPPSSTHQDYNLQTAINLVQSYPGVIGFKTGYTDEAGLTLVTLAKRGQYEVLGVLLGATDRRGDARTLLDYSFEKLGAK